jgi:hypothetical protein
MATTAAKISRAAPFAHLDPLQVHWRGSLSLCEVIRSRPAPARGATAHDYYVHYCSFNRRLDEWIDDGKIDWAWVKDGGFEEALGARERDRRAAEERGKGRGKVRLRVFFFFFFSFHFFLSSLHINL